MGQVRGNRVQVAVAVTPAEELELNEIAADRGISRSDVIRDLMARGKLDYYREMELLGRRQPVQDQADPAA